MTRYDAILPRAYARADLPGRLPGRLDPAPVRRHVEVGFIQQERLDELGIVGKDCVDLPRDGLVHVEALRHGTSDSRSSDSSNTQSNSIRDEHGVSSSASTSDGTYARSGEFSRASTSSSSSQGIEDSLARAKSYSEAARKMEELSQSLSRDASYAETHDMQLRVCVRTHT